MNEKERQKVESLRFRAELDAHEYEQELYEIGRIEFGLPSDCSFETLIVKAVENHNDEILFNIMNGMELYYNAIGSKNAYDRILRYEAI